MTGRPTPPLVGRAVGLAGSVGTGAKVLGASGILRPIPPTALARMGKALKDWGTGPAGGFTAMAVREPRRIGLIDELGSLTWGEMHRRSNALARALAERGVGEGDSVAIMCRNHRGFVDACVATAKLGADILLLNTAFAGPQLVDVLEREGPQVVIHDEEFTGLLAKAPHRRPDPGVGRLRLRRGRHRRPGDGVRRLRRRPAPAPLPHRDPHLGHHRHPQGSAAQRGGSGRRGLAAVAAAAALRLAHPHRRPAVPHLGLRPPRARDAARLDRGAAPQVRRRGLPVPPSRTSAATRWSSSR